MITVNEMVIELKKELPRFYDQIKDFSELVNADALVLTDLQNSVDDVLDQLFIEKTTWGLDRWEEFFGIYPDSSKPIDQRRSVLKSKIRGAGVTTVSLVKDVAESWYNGEIEVIEMPEKVEIKFTSNYGVPANLQDVKNALREIVPAHLLIEYVFLFILIKDIHQSMTLTEVESLTLNKFAGGDS
ncbi:putative phage tail protein [Mesobacillus stamsii]|uniref:DUF2313 domain-containing protein n=1 Tax=Mesobacillus stamsii TaxID=225347 RepID=A0ABU0FTR4_9BACI|nr:putative phage tail protein [Mesobacillus stamsii]MDQ0412734.1 hypothetical protein [Mesobacillus stamsii]